MARQKITIEERVREFCLSASESDIREMRKLLDSALLFRFCAKFNAEPQKRQRKAKSDQVKLAGAE